MLVIRDDGHVMGSVSGGCVEDDLIEKVRAKAVAADKPHLMTYGVTNEDATRWGLPCGGTLQVVLEPVTERSELGTLLEVIGKQQLIKRRLEMDTGRVTVEPGRWSDVLEFDGKHFKSQLAPKALIAQPELKARLGALRGKRVLRLEPELAFTMVYMHLFNYFLIETVFGGDEHYGVPETKAVDAIADVFLHGVLAKEAA